MLDKMVEIGIQDPFFAAEVVFDRNADMLHLASICKDEAEDITTYPNA